jgi:hypothetical protein
MLRDVERDKCVCVCDYGRHFFDISQLEQEKVFYDISSFSSSNITL